MKSPQCYRAFGLNIVSDLPFSSTGSSTFDIADLEIRHDAIAPYLNDSWALNKLSFKNWEAMPGRFLMKVHGVADFLAIDGSTLIIERAHKDVADDAVIVYVMGSMMAAILQQRGISILHSSAVKIDNTAAIFAGKSGAGKSTLAVNMMTKGFALIADDIVALQKNATQIVCATPSFPSARLWEDALEKLSCANSVTMRVRPELDKFYISASSFCDTPQPVGAVYILNEHNNDSIIIEPVETKEAFHTLNHQGFRNGFLKGHKTFTHHFQNIAHMANTVPLFSIHRPGTGFKLNELSDEIISHHRTVASEGANTN